MRAVLIFVFAILLIWETGSIIRIVFYKTENLILKPDNFTNALDPVVEIISILSSNTSKIQLTNASDLPINDLINSEKMLSEVVLPKSSSKDGIVMGKIETGDIIHLKTISEDFFWAKNLTKVIIPETRENEGVLSLDLWEPNFIDGASVGTFQGRIPKGEKRFGRYDWGHVYSPVRIACFIPSL